MIEAEMIFALGFCTAGLLALAFLPVVWKRALRLTTRRLRQLVPLSPDEIVAERDQLRAASAVALRRLEQKLEHAEAAKNEGIAALGRRDVALAALKGEIARAEERITELTAERDATILELNGVRGETGTAAIALHDLTGLAEKRRWEALAAEEQARELQNALDQGRATIAALETRSLGLESQLSDTNRVLATVRAELGRTAEAVKRAASERDTARASAESATRERASLEAQLEAQRDLASDSGKRAVEQAQAVAASLATIEALRAETGTLSRALATLREERRGAPGAEPGETDLAALRRAISQVADDVLRMTEKAGAPKQPSSSEPDRAEALAP